MPDRRSLAYRAVSIRSRSWLITSMLVLLALAAAGSVTAAFRAAPLNAETYTAPPGPPAPTRAPVSVYFIGDSVTGGAAGSGRENQRYGNVMAARLNWRVTTDAVGATGFVAKGPETSRVDARFGTRVQKILNANPDVVIVAGGRNDMYSNLAEVEANATDFYSQLRAGLPEAKIVTLAGWRWDTTAERKAIAPQAAIAEILRGQSDRIGGVFIDPVHRLPMFNDDNALQLVSEDQFHPTAEGYRVLGEALARVMVAEKFPRGPEVWKETGVMSGKYVDELDKFWG